MILRGIFFFLTILPALILMIVMTRVSILQFQPILADVDANISKISELFAKSEECDLFVLPELASTGYGFSDRNQALSCSEELADSRYVDFLEQYCERHT